MFKHVGLALLLLILGSHSAAAESNQQLTEILADNPAIEIKQLTENMSTVLPDLPTSPVQTLWNAGVDSETWDEVRIELLVAQVRDAEMTLVEVEKYSQQYAYVFQHRNDDVVRAKQWLMRVGGLMFQMKKQVKLFKQRVRYLKKTLPQVIKSTAHLYENANNEKKTMLRLRLQAQLLCYQVIDFPTDVGIQDIQSQLAL